MESVHWQNLSWMAGLTVVDGVPVFERSDDTGPKGKLKQVRLENLWLCYPGIKSA